MTLQDIATIRLHSQQLMGATAKQPEEVVRALGAMQAQDYSMSKWAIGIRLPNSNEADVEKAVHQGNIIRTHVLRPTWHLIAPEDVRWMASLSSAKLLSAMKTRDKELELTEKIYTKSNAIIEKVLSNGEHLTREELVGVLAQHRVKANGQQAAHLLFRAEIEGIVCSGGLKEKNHSYALLEDRVKKTKPLSKEEALAKLATTYFTSHAPATLKDFTWWSGLSITESKHALELVKEKFIAENVGAEDYWIPNSFKLPKTSSSLLLLPAFDEYIISYKDRTAVLDLAHQKIAFTSNGIFRPTILINGKGEGVWSRTIQKDTVHIETTFFAKTTKAVKEQLEEEARAYAHFLGKQVFVTHKQ